MCASREGHACVADKSEWMAWNTWMTTTTTIVAHVLSISHVIYVGVDAKVRRCRRRCQRREYCRTLGVRVQSQFVLYNLRLCVCVQKVRTMTMMRLVAGCSCYGLIVSTNVLPSFSLSRTFQATIVSWGVVNDEFSMVDFPTTTFVQLIFQPRWSAFQLLIWGYDSTHSLAPRLNVTFGSRSSERKG